MMFQLNPKRRHSGMDSRNLGSMDGGVGGHPCNLDSGGPCRNDGLAIAGKNQQHCPTPPAESNLCANL